MAITTPPDLTRGKVSWTVGRTDGTTLPGARGTVRFEATAVAVAYSTATVLPSPVETPVLAGVMTPVDLLVNDPEVWNWRVTPRVGVAWPAFHIDVAGPVDLATAAVVPGKGPIRAVKGEKGAQGASLAEFEQVSDNTLRAVIEDPLTGTSEVETFTLPRGPEGPYGGTEVTDPQVASFIGRSAGTATAAAMDQAYRRGFSVKEWGAKGDGVTDDTLSIQAAADSVVASGADAVLYFPEGIYVTSEPVVLPCSVDAAAATISYTGAGIAVTLGDDRAAGLVTFRKVMRAPRVVCATKPSPGWAAGRTGVRLTNLNACDVYLPLVRNFETGVSVYGLAAGNVHNTITLGSIDNNKVNLVLDADATGWSNQNVFIGGRLQYLSSEGDNVAGARQLYIAPAAHEVNNNLFLNPSFEGDTPEYHLDISGTANVILNGRYEVTGGARVRWRGGATQNQILYGYMSTAIVETWDQGAHPSNNVIATQGGHIASGVPTILEQTSGSSAAVDVVMAPGAVVSKADPATAYSVRRSADDTRMKRTTDAYPRVLFDHVNGRVHFGRGTAASTVAVGYAAGDLLVLDAGTETTARPAGGAEPLPATPAGYLKVLINGASRRIPYY